MTRTIGVALWLLFAGLANAQDAVAPEEAFRRGVDLVKAGQHREAIPYFLIAYRAFPESQGVLWNLGISTAEISDHTEALKYWSAYRNLRPDNWRVYAKLVQSYQALGDTTARDRERSALIELRRSAGPNTELSRVDRYCREQMVIAGRKVLAFEFFEPKGDRPVFLAFVVATDSGSEDFRISLGSYETTNRIAWETGSLPRDKRLYHLDGYERGGLHLTIGFYDAMPTYETVRARVDDIMNARAKPVPSSPRQ